MIKGIWFESDLLANCTHPLFLYCAVDPQSSDDQKLWNTILQIRSGKYLLLLHSFGSCGQNASTFPDDLKPQFTSVSQAADISPNCTTRWRDPCHADETPCDLVSPPLQSDPCSDFRKLNAEKAFTWRLWMIWLMRVLGNGGGYSHKCANHSKTIRESEITVL